MSDNWAWLGWKIQLHMLHIFTVFFQSHFYLDLKLGNSYNLYLTSSAVSTLWINDAPIVKIHAVSVCGDVGVPLARAIDTVFAHLKALSVSQVICRINDGAGSHIKKLFSCSLSFMQHFIFICNSWKESIKLEHWLTKGWKGLLGTNTLAFWAHSYVMKKIKYCWYYYWKQLTPALA